MTTASAMDLSSLEKDPRLFLYTSLTAGSSHIITATSRMETILKANKIPFQAIDTATDEKARRLWQRRAGKRKLPGLVKEGYVIGDLEEVEEWNEFGELKENIGPVPANNAAPAGGQAGVNIAPASPYANKPANAGLSSPSPAAAASATKTAESGFDKSKGIALPGAAEIAARNQAKSSSSLEAINPETLTTSPKEKQTSISFAKDTAPPKNVASEQPAVPAAPKEEPVAAKEATTSDKTPVTTQSENISSDVKTESDKSESVAAQPAPSSRVNESAEPATSTTDPTPAEASSVVESSEGSHLAGAEAEGAISKHQGSFMKPATTEDTKQAEEKTAVSDSTKEDETSGPAKGIEDLKVDESTKKETQEQDPKEASDATQSVED